MKNQRFLILVMLLSSVACMAGCRDRKIYLDPSADLSARVEDLLGRMTTEEKVMQLTQRTYGKNMNVNNVETEMRAVSPLTGSLIFRTTNPVFYNQIQRKAVEESRLGIPLLCGFDAIHGYRTLFPIPLAQACSWNEQLVERSCRIVAVESRRSGVAWTFSPMIDVARDVRWGRISEGYGEDPLVNARMGVAAVKGYQGEDLSSSNSIAACLKHYVGYAYSEGGRDYHYTDISAQSLWETALPPFEACVKAGAATVMSSFNDISGVPATANRYTLTEILRDRWHFNGFVVSDWGAVEQLISQRVAANRSEACAMAIRSGLDMDMVDNVYCDELEALVKQGVVSKEVLDEAVRRVLKVKFRLGLFEHPYIKKVSESELAPSVEARAVAREMASESMVLLKNEGQLLPVAADVRRIALLGPMADNQIDLMGSWWGQGEPTDVVTILKGMEAEFAGKAQIRYCKGCDFEGDDRSQFAEAIEAARSADLVVLCMGEKRGWSGENASRASLALPPIQEQFIEEMAHSGKPIVLLLSSGRPVEVRRMEPHAGALVEIWQPGTEGGSAVAQLLSGKVNPSGRLAITFPVCAEQQPVFYNQRTPARKMGYYQDIPKTPQYPFGYGLSYTTFEYGSVKLDRTILYEGDRLHAEVLVSNTGAQDGKETVMWFISDETSSISRPAMELKHFDKQAIPAGESRKFSFEIDPWRDLSFTDSTGKLHLEKGTFYLQVHGQKIKFELQ